MSFHDVRFPTDISVHSLGGPERRTEIVTLASGHEERNTPWAHSRRRYDAGYGIKTLDEMHDAIAFFEARLGKLYGFRWRDPLDHKSCVPSHSVAATDQILGTGDGTTQEFQLVKNYTSGGETYCRPITKPIVASLLLASDGMIVDSGSYECDATTGLMTFEDYAIPAPGKVITAGFEFDVPVRFDTDALKIDLAAFAAGEIPNLPVIEVKS